jgi:hypothetical protein
LIQKPIAPPIRSSGDELTGLAAMQHRDTTKNAGFNVGLEIFRPGQLKKRWRYAMQNQPELPLIHFPFQEYLGNFKRVRKAIVKAIKGARTWKQLPLKLYVKTLFKVRTGFYWTRPDGRQFFCKTIRNLVARVMDYDGHLLQATLRKLK